MDQSTRNKLRSVVGDVRRILERGVRDVLEGRYGVHSDGRVEEESSLKHLDEEEIEYRRQVLVHLDHIRASGVMPARAAEQLVREVAFTHLNRLAAFKLMAERGLIRDAVGKGLKSNGFLFYLSDHDEDHEEYKQGRQDLAYRHYLLWLAQTHAEDVPALFSSTDSANRLFPAQRDLDAVLDMLNDGSLEGIWESDEAIGWIYQYFTPKEQRDRARKESSAPRNYYELAFLNQFYTPRYVVQFLVDNTLGRTWYEMMQGNTGLKEYCQYLVFRPTERFLAQGAEADDQSEDVDYVAYRPKKDPREIRVLDPAVGSGHFLLYAFDVLEIIYKEAYDDEEAGTQLRADFTTIDDLKRAIPALIVERNLYGIDIDLRAVQIAALALWLRAQRSFKSQGVNAGERPPVRRGNIVTAEPMPGEKTLLDEFANSLKHEYLRGLLRAVFDDMRLARDVGALFKIEERIADEIKKFVPASRGTMFAAEDIGRWEQAESRLVKALEQYSIQAAPDIRLQRRLFAEDAAHGFAFIDVLRKKYDVVLMNPPFGKSSKPSKKYIDKAYPRTKNDLYAAFVERGVGLLHRRGMLGAITSRTGFFLSSFQKWREDILLQEARPTLMADLGYGVLDTAMVETAAYCMEAG